MNTIELARNSYEQHVANPNDAFKGLNSLMDHLMKEGDVDMHEAEKAALYAHTEYLQQQASVMRSNAASARDMLGSLEQTNSTLKGMTDSAEFTGDRNMARALILIRKVQADLHQQLVTVLG